MSSYLFFNTEFSRAFVGSGKGDHKAAMSAAGAKWGTLTDEEKAPYAAKAAESKAAFEKQVA